MQVSVESGEGLEKRVLVDLPAEKVDAVVDAKLKQVARTARLDGFRPGKVPMRVLKQQFGGQIRQEAYGELIQSSFYEAIQKENLQLVGEPSIELREAGDSGFSYTATFETMPEVKVADMSGVEIQRPVTEIEESDVDAMIAKLRSQRTVWNEVDREAADGDSIVMDFKGMIDGEVFDGGSGEDMPLTLGSGSMIEGFEAGLLGVKAGETRTLDLTFPEQYRAEHLAGKEASFEVSVKKVSEPELPEVNEEFVKALGVEDGKLESLRAEITANMQRESKQKIRSLTKERVMNALLEHNEVHAPKAMVEQESRALKQQMEAEMAQSGQKSSLDLPLNVFESQASRRVQLGLLVGEIVKEQKITVDQERVKEAISDMASTYENPQEIIDWYQENDQQRGAVENVVMEDQVVDWLLGQVKVVEDKQSFDELLGNKAQ